MRTCPACQETLPADSLFCGICGFRLTPIAMTDSVKGGQVPQVVASARGFSGSEVLANAATDAVGQAGADVPEHRSGGPARRAQRFPLKVEVNYASEHNFYTGFLQNVSSGGLFVATHHLASVGDAVNVEFTIPGLPRSCEATCEVTWVRDHHVAGSDSSPGMGLRFLNLDTSVAEAIDVFIGHREPIFFEE